LKKKKNKKAISLFYPNIIGEGDEQRERERENDKKR
jgi:hypothetical protein